MQNLGTRWWHWPAVIMFLILVAYGIIAGGIGVFVYSRNGLMTLPLVHSMWILPVALLAIVVFIITLLRKRKQ